VISWLKVQEISGISGDVDVDRCGSMRIRNVNPRDPRPSRIFTIPHREVRGARSCERAVFSKAVFCSVLPEFYQ
jgi:hypothetical protein